MKIAVICHAQYPIAQPFAGGLESITHSICSELQRRGHYVDLFAHQDSDKRFRVFPVDVDSSPTSVVEGAKEIAGETARRVFEIAENLRYGSALASLAANDYDLIQNHSLHPVPVLMGLATGIPMVTTLHTPPIPYLKMSALAVADARQHRFVAVSASLAGTWAPYASGIEVIRNGIDVTRWKPAAKKPATSAFWFGRICPEKAPHHAVQAARRGNFPLQLAGPIYDETYFRTVLEPLLGEQVRYLGHRDPSQLNEHLKSSTATLFTSVWEEPYGLTIAESLASGTPVVAYNVGAAPELITPASGVIVARDDIGGLVDGFFDASRLDRSECRRRAEQFCGIESMIEGYLRLYHQMIDSSTVFALGAPSPETTALDVAA